MWFVYIILLLNIVNVSYQINITEDLTKLAFPKLYAQHIKEYIRSNEERNKTFCQPHMDEYANKLINGINLWALKWFDSGTKIPSGILKGNIADLGNFDECVQTKTSIDNMSVYGKYCLVIIPIISITAKITNRIQNYDQQTRAVTKEGEIGFMFATCLPDSCSSKEIQAMYTYKYLPKVSVSDEYCYSQSIKPKLTNGDIAFITFLGIVLLVIILSTMYDIYLFYANEKPPHVILNAFSAFTNGKKLITFSKNPNQISCLHGIRAISMMWIILCHRFLMISSMHPIKNYVDVFKWLNTEGNMYILGATVSVDTFLLLSGVVVSYVFMLTTAKGAKFNVFIFYIHRYIRLTPLYAVIMVLYITVLIHLGSGPYWKKSVAGFAQPCIDNWWTNLLYVQNYVNPQRTCLPQTWYLAVDTQLYILAPLILIPLGKWPKIGIIITSSLGIASMIASFVTGYVYKIHGFILANRNAHFITDYYMATHTRATPWFIGILLGYYIFKIKINKEKIIINQFSVLLIWLVSLGILAACIFTGHNTLTDPYDRIGNAFYIALMRPGWALAVSAVIILCELGYGGPINWFLSATIFEFISRLTYSMYLIHMGLEMVVQAQIRTASDMNDLTLMHGFWGDYIFTVCIAVIFTLAFESPIITIESFLLGRKTEKKAADTVESGKTIRND